MKQLSLVSPFFFIPLSHWYRCELVAEGPSADTLRLRLLLWLAIVAGASEMWWKLRAVKGDIVVSEAAFAALMVLA